MNENLATILERVTGVMGAVLDAAAGRGEPYDLSGLEWIVSVGVTGSGDVKERLLRHGDLRCRDVVAASEGRDVVPGGATLDVDGTVVFKGRDSRVINTGGEKVFAEEVEQVLQEHPEVDDAHVVGVPASWASRTSCGAAPSARPTWTAARQVIETKTPSATHDPGTPHPL